MVRLQPKFANPIVNTKRNTEKRTKTEKGFSGISCWTAVKTLLLSPLKVSAGSVRENSFAIV